MLDDSAAVAARRPFLSPARILSKNTLHNWVHGCFSAGGRTTTGNYQSGRFEYFQLFAGVRASLGLNESRVKKKQR